MLDPLPAENLRMTKNFRSSLAIAICLMGSVFSDPCHADSIDFNRDIRPILSNKCFACHGPDEDQLEAGLRLDAKAAATAKLDSDETAIVPGKPDASALIARVTSTDESERMPPARFGKPLSPSEIETLRRWIEQGADYATHWAYVPPVRPEPPQAAPEHASWTKNPIDQFVLQTMLTHGLKPSPEADRYALVRRVFLDLTGLPPTLAEAEQFVNDPSATAYESLVDNLLRRESFGEHWARKWLDLARYADSAGYADDPPRTIWAYRDWVIRAINQNIPFDEFTRLQLAADLLPNASEEQLIATGFHRNTLTNNEGGTQDEEFRNVAVVDRVNTTMAVWMGTTMACAQCHTHKYDPITQSEYFQFFDLWNQTADADRRDESPVLQIFTAEQKAKKAQWEQEIAQLRKVIDTSTPELVAAQQTWEQRLLAEPTWSPLQPKSLTRSSKLPGTVQEDGSILVTESAETDTYTVMLQGAQQTANDATETKNSHTIASLRLETLPHASLPGGGAGHGGGNLVITGVRLDLIPPESKMAAGRFIRIVNRGKQKMLSLAEVEVFSGGKNVATKGKASQHSTDFGGPPEYAIDGNTDGDYLKKSVTHTAIVDDPWWEVDLGENLPVEKIKLWNRTDGNLQTRLKDFTVSLLDAERQVVWEQSSDQSPNPSAEFAISNHQAIEFALAAADYHQASFEPSDVLLGKTGASDGWAIGGQTTQPHELVLVLKKPLLVTDEDTLRLTIEQNSTHKSHLLGHFRLSATDSVTAGERLQLAQSLRKVLKKSPADRSADEATALAKHFRAHVAAELQPQREQLQKTEKDLADMKPATSVPILRELDKNRRVTRLQYRGNYLDLGPELQAGVPAVFSTPDSPPIKDRLSLAHWLTDAANPLTARVIANRYWENLFGRGIVATSEEFGSQGDTPTHPQLLDWLATELVASKWDTRSLVRTLVLSATYRQSSKFTDAAAALDPDNRWLSIGPRVRMSAEMVRDQALAVSGLLSPKMYGPPVNPPQPNLGLSAAFGGSTDWKTSEGEDRYRRAIYTTWRRSNPYPSMATFDAPNREVCTIRRNRTNTPLQSLVTLNDPVYVEAAQALARLALAFDPSLDRQLEYAFRRCVLRPPTEKEMASLRALYADSQKDFVDQQAEAMKLATDPLGKLPEGMSPTDAAAMTVVSNVLLNLDEMFLKR